MADQRATNFPPAAPHEMKAKTASVWRKHKAVLAILATALSTVGLLTVPAAAPAHADGNCDQFALNGNYKVIDDLRGAPNPITAGFTPGPQPPPAPYNGLIGTLIGIQAGGGSISSVVYGGDGWMEYTAASGPIKVEGNLDYALLYKDYAGVNRIQFAISFSANATGGLVGSVSRFDGTVANNGSASGWFGENVVPPWSPLQEILPWRSVTPLGCSTTPVPCGEQPPPSGVPLDASGEPIDGGLLDEVNKARAHPENYIPLDDDKAMAQMNASDCCGKWFTYRDILSNVAHKHNVFLAGHSDPNWISIKRTTPHDPQIPNNLWDRKVYNAHTNDDTIWWTMSADQGEGIDQAGYHSARGEIVASNQPTAPALQPVQQWMQHDAASQWGHRNAILSCGQLKDWHPDPQQEVPNLPDYQDAGAAHYPRSNADPPGPWSDYWTVDFGTP